MKDIEFRKSLALVGNQTTTFGLIDTPQNIPASTDDADFNIYCNVLNEASYQNTLYTANCLLMVAWGKNVAESGQSACVMGIPRTFCKGIRFPGRTSNPGIRRHKVERLISR
jgi:hypothetical protein